MYENMRKCTGSGRLALDGCFSGADTSGACIHLPQSCFLVECEDIRRNLGRAFSFTSLCF